MVKFADYVYNETRNFDQAKADLENRPGHAIELVLGHGVTIVISIGLSMLTVQSVTRPIRKLCTQAKKAAKGDFTAKTKIETVDEIAVLTDSFNDMTAEIGVLVENIKKQEKT